jgi:hypothetical protein
MWVVRFKPQTLYPRGKSPRYPLDRRLSEPQNRSRSCGEEKKSNPDRSARSPAAKVYSTHLSKQNRPSLHLSRNQCLLRYGRCSCDSYSMCSTQLSDLLRTEVRTLSTISCFTPNSWESFSARCCNVLPKRSVLLCDICAQKDSMQRIFIQKCFLFTVGKVCCVKRFTTGWQTFRWWRRGWNGGVEVAETTDKRLLCCGFRRTGKAMGQVYQCLWRIWLEINVFPQVRISHVWSFVSICDLFTSPPSYGSPLPKYC